MQRTSSKGSARHLRTASASSRSSTKSTNSGIGVLDLPFTEQVDTSRITSEIERQVSENAPISPIVPPQVLPVTPEAGFAYLRVKDAEILPMRSLAWWYFSKLFTVVTSGKVLT